MTNESNSPSQSVITGLAMLGGLGLTIIVIVAAIGVFNPPDSDPGSLRLFFVVGTMALLVSILAWLALTRPYEHFDDINIPQYHGHNHHNDEEQTNDDEATEPLH